MTRKLLISLMGVLEAVTGLALLASPSSVSKLLLGVGLETPAAETVGRVAGGALLTLGILCWIERDDTEGRGLRGLIAAMLIYNIAVTTVLVFARASAGLSGIALWPAVVVHSAIAVWCIVCITQDCGRGAR